MFIGALFAVPLIFSPTAQLIGSWYPPYLGISAVIGLACMVVFVDDEEMGCLHLYRLCSPQSGCVFCHGSVEPLGVVNTCGSYILRFEECFKNDVTNLPDSGMQRRLIALDRQ
jgi:hypothetical protein